MIVKATKMRVTRPRYQQFTDVSTDEWFAPYVTAVSTRGWMSPKTDFAWQPNGSVNRAETAKIIISALYPRVAIVSSSQLKDVPSTEWYARFANVVFEEDLLPIENDEFKPAQPVTRAEVAQMIAKLLQKYSLELRFSNLLRSNNINLYTTALKSFDTQEFLSSLLEKVRPR